MFKVSQKLSLSEPYDAGFGFESILTPDPYGFPVPVNRLILQYICPTLESLVVDTIAVRRSESPTPHEAAMDLDYRWEVFWNLHDARWRAPADRSDRPFYMNPLYPPGYRPIMRRHYWCVVVL